MFMLSINQYFSADERQVSLNVQVRTMELVDWLIHTYENTTMQLYSNFCTFKNDENFMENTGIFSSPEPLGSQGELIGWP